jgi:hypothetical protein
MKDKLLLVALILVLAIGIAILITHCQERQEEDHSLHDGGWLTWKNEEGSISLPSFSLVHERADRLLDIP